MIQFQQSNYVSKSVDMLRSIIQRSQTLISFFTIHHHQHTNNTSIQKKLMQELLRFEMRTISPSIIIIAMEITKER